MYSLSVSRQRISLRSSLKTPSAISAGELLMIFRIASFSSELSFRSGATEKKRLNIGSVSSRSTKITAALNVLKFFLAISSTAVS